MDVNISSKCVRGGYLLKIGKARTLTVMFVMLVVLSLHYFYRLTSLQSASLQESASLNVVLPEMPHNVIVPEMPHNVMINTVGKTQLVLTVFYECLCPDSKSFFIKHLLPSIVKVPQFISAVLVPYGKAKTIMRQGEYRFTCQHGEVECFGNKIHACVIAKVQDVLIQVQIITCMIADNIDPKEIGRKCCESHDVDWLPIQACALGIEGDALLKQHGDKTNSLVPRVTFIPTVLINGNRGNQAAILKNLWKELCREVCMWHPPSTKYIDVMPVTIDECSG